MALMPYDTPEAAALATWTASAAAEAHISFEDARRRRVKAHSNSLTLARCEAVGTARYDCKWRVRSRTSSEYTAADILHSDTSIRRPSDIDTAKVQ